MAVSIAELVFYLPNAVSMVFFPHVAGSSREEADQQAPLVSRVTLLLTGGVAVALVPVAFLLISLLIPAFAPALPAMLILLPGVVALSVTKVLTGYATGLGRTGMISIVTIGAFLLNVALNLFLIPAFGILGASTASLISYSASSIALSVVLGRLAGVRATAFWIPRRSDVRYIGQTLSGLAPPPALPPRSRPRERRGQPIQPEPCLPAGPDRAFCGTPDPSYHGPTMPRPLRLVPRHHACGGQ